MRPPEDREPMRGERGKDPAAVARDKPAATSRASWARNDPLAAMVLRGAHGPDRIMIAGEWLVIDGAPVGLDLDRLIAEHRRAALDFA